VVNALAEGKSAARRLFRHGLTSVKESTLICAVIVMFVRLSCFDGAGRVGVGAILVGAE
jgi:hypothetical protein